MKFNQILIAVYLLLGSFIQSPGMGYWQQVKNYFSTTASNQDQKLNKEFQDLLSNEKFEQAIILFKKDSELNPHEKHELKEIIIKTTVQAALWNSQKQEDFIQKFLKPVFATELLSTNDIFYAIYNNYFKSSSGLDQSLVFKALDFLIHTSNNIILITLSNIKELSPMFVEVLLFKTQNKQLAQAIITLNRFPEYITRFATDILSNGTESSPTMIHLKRHWQSVVFADTYYIYKPFLENPELKNLYNNFRKKEQELNRHGFYTFVHGQRRQFYFPERLYTHLWELRKEQPVKNFLFIHLNDLIETCEDKLKEKTLRKTIHKSGDILCNKTLFMNYAFFANHSGANSALYVMENTNARPIQISIKEPFKLMGYGQVYEKNKQEIEQLVQDFEKLSIYGNMLLIAVPKDKIHKLMYVCDANAKHSSLFKQDGTKITDIRIVMETLLKNPEALENSDHIEFCLIMTQVKGGLDPSTGIQIYPLLSGDPEKLKTLQAREKILLDKITADVKEAEKQQALQRAAKITGHVTESAQAK